MSTAAGPRWGHAERESHAATFLAMVAIGVAHLFLPAQLAALRAPEATGWAVVALAVVLYAAHTRLGTGAERALRAASVTLLALVVLTNLVSLGLLVDDVVTAGGLDARDLLLGGAIVWATNVAAFGFLFWQADRGGPYARAHGSGDRLPDLLFPQMGDDRYAARFRPAFVDYLYVALTNAFAFSPTDTMPMSRPVKGLFAVESLISFATIGVVAARAVNILPS